MTTPLPSPMPTRRAWPLFVMSLLFGAEASAHMSMTSPVARYPIVVGNENKACPCGVGDSNRLCDNPDDRSDPDRSTDRINTFTAGEVITIRFDEYVAHAGRWRVAFDPDGADLDDFNANILLDVPDPAGSTGNIGQGSLWELQVTLPDIACDNCTLQLVQMMDGNTVDPVPDPAGRSSYYQCADLVLTAAAAADGGTADAGVADAGAADAGTHMPTDAGGDVHDAGDDVIDAGDDLIDAGGDVIDAGDDVIDAGGNDPDAGDDIVDAGGNDPDAGDDVIDAGGNDPDAGDVLDAGSDAQDAGDGVVDAGDGNAPPPQTSGCTCDASDPSDSVALMALCAVGLLGAAFRRRRHSGSSHPFRLK